MPSLKVADCFADMAAGCWIAVGLAQDKGAAFAEMVIASDRWAFPRVAIPDAAQFLAEFGEHCRCQKCRPARAPSRCEPKQLSLF